LIDRFQIEDLIVQDDSGVVFRAVDTETGHPVALRRFFPFGAAGGGLEADEQTAYNIAAARLADLRHPALRSVICGGCDPVDGIPFIVTEWIDGGPIGPLLREGPLPPAVAAELLTQALEVCELLSQVLAEEAVWVETDPDTIILGSEASGRGFTFWISPLKWLGGGEQPRGLESIVKLTEDLLGWHGRIVNDQAGNGLGAWLKWLRGAASRTSLREARENLAAALGNEPPALPKQLLTEARRLQPAPRKPSKIMVLAVVGLVLVALGVGGLLWTQHRAAQLAQSEVFTQLLAEMERQPRDTPGVDEVNELAARLSTQLEAEWQGGVFSAGQGELIARHPGSEVSIEDVVRRIGSSQSGKTLYLLFSEDPGREDPRVAVALEDATGDLGKDALEALVGRKVRITGIVRLTHGRPEIPVQQRDAIELID